MITHTASQAARFLGYDIVMQHGDYQHDREGKRCINGRIGLRVPPEVVEKRCALYKKRDKPSSRLELLQDSDYTIMDRYQSEYRGIVQYYLMAYNVSTLGKLRWTMEQSLVRTLASKHRTKISTVLRKHRAHTQTLYGPMRCLKVTVARDGDKRPLVAYFGGIPLRRQRQATIHDHVPLHLDSSRNELVKRLLADTCELCGQAGNCEVHHIRKLADLKKPGRREKPKWVKLMAARRRKTLIVCSNCHDAIHSGRYQGQKRRE